jgi:uncharacterized protein YegP (UPF0339 family)
MPQKGSRRALRIQYYTDKDGKTRFRFKSSNGKVMAVSGDGYSTQAMAAKAVTSIIVDIREANIVWEVE